MICPTEILTLGSEAVKAQGMTLVCCEGGEGGLAPITHYHCNVMGCNAVRLITTIVMYYCPLLTTITMQRNVILCNVMIKHLLL